MKTKRKSLPLRIIAVCTICALDLLCGVGYLYYVNMRGGTLFYASHASDNICGTLRQGLIVAACPFLLFLISLSVLKRLLGRNVSTYLRKKAGLNDCTADFRVSNNDSSRSHSQRG